MTALCGGGASQIQPGIGPSVIVDATLITGGLSLISPYLIPVAGLVDGFVFEALSQCASDPPPMPAIADLNPANAIGGVLNGNFQTWRTAVNNLLLNYFWHQWCQCTGTSTPAFVAPPAPAGVTVNVSTGEGLCGQGSWYGTIPCASFHSGSLLGDSMNLSVVLPTSPLPGRTITGQGASFLAPHIPSGVTGYSWSHAAATMAACPGTPTSGAAIAFFDATGTQLTGGSLRSPTYTGGLTDHGFDTIPANAVYWYAWGQSSTGSCVCVDQPYQLSLQTYCNGAQPGTANQPCTTDPATLNLLSQIYQLLTLVQRQSAPFGYVPGATHTGLTGLGELAVADLLGVKITPSTLPAVYGQQLGDPDELWLESWITWGNADGWSDRVWLRHSPQVSLPALAGQYTKLGYSLAPGLVVNITELVREP